MLLINALCTVRFYSRCMLFCSPLRVLSSRVWKLLSPEFCLNHSGLLCNWQVWDSWDFKISTSLASWYRMKVKTNYLQFLLKCIERDLAIFPATNTNYKYSTKSALFFLWMLIDESSEIWLPLTVVICLIFVIFHSSRQSRCNGDDGEWILQYLTAKCFFICSKWKQN